LSKFDFRFYIGCDVCADWLHGSCINISPEEADKFEVYVCPRCSTEKKQEFLNKPINNEIKKDLLNLTDQLLVKKIKYSKNFFIKLSSRHIKWHGHFKNQWILKMYLIIIQL